jgi:hypothetical protein
MADTEYTREASSMETLLAECRDAFPIPEPGTQLEQLWAQAMGDPWSVPAYVSAALPSASLGEHTHSDYKAQEFCRFPDCRCPMDPGPEPDWCARGLPHVLGSSPEENGNG